MSDLKRIKDYIKNYFELKQDEYFAVKEKSKGCENSYVIPIKTIASEKIYGLELSTQKEFWRYLCLNGLFLFFY